MTEPGDFKVDWTGARQSFTTLGSGRSAKAPSHVSRLFTWTDLDRNGNPKRTGGQFRHMFYSKLDIANHEEWQFERPLGRGGFGAAALFQKRDADQRVVDEFALKVTDIRAKYNVHDSKVGLTIEAAVMAQTNELQCNSIVRLRQFKEHSYERFCRYYFEFCNQGSLYDLALKYSAWNMHFPEPFLWHVFYHLAQGCAKFEEGPYRSLHQGSFGEELVNGYLLHGDIKLDNILLCSNHSPSPGGKLYPIPKFADFGLATTTDPRRRASNRASALQRGHPLWVPPELRVTYMKDPNRYFFEYDSHGFIFPFGMHPRDQHRIRCEANIWAVGAVMWALTTLGDIRMLSKNINGILMGHREARATFDGTNLIGGFGQSAEQRYSNSLFELIQECTRMRPWERPSGRELLENLEPQMQELEKNIEVIRLKGDESQLAVYFKGNEFIGLPEGDAALPPKTEHFWSDFANHLIWQPPECELFCPPSAPNRLPLTDRCPDAVRKSVQRKWKAAIHIRDGKKFPPPTRPSGPTKSTTPRRRKRRAHEMDPDIAENEGGWKRWLRKWKWWESEQLVADSRR